MFEIVLFEPEIPPNTGNIIRLCANCGANLHLIHPLGFAIDDAQVRRAGLDYREMARVKEYASWQEFELQVHPERLFAVSTRGQRHHSEFSYQPGDAFVFGPETRGLPQQMLEKAGPERVLRIPMQAGSRSLNLSNAAAVIVYEAWRQQGFGGAAPDHTSR